MFDPSTDTKPPQFDVSCPVHVTVVARGGKNSASVRWGRITARDNSGNVKVTPKNIKQPQIMVEGRHTIPYMAEDAEKNRQFCDVNINVIGELLNDNLKRCLFVNCFVGLMCSVGCVCVYEIVIIIIIITLIAVYSQCLHQITMALHLQTTQLSYILIAQKCTCSNNN